MAQPTPIVRVSGGGAGGTACGPRPPAPSFLLLSPRERAGAWASRADPGGHAAGKGGGPDSPPHPARPGTLCLEICRVSKLFGERPALRDVSLNVQAGEVLAVIGPNGSGKTTLFNLISGVMRPSAGRIRLFGQDITGWPMHRILHRGLARTFQIPQPFGDLTVLENVALGLMFGPSRVRSLAAAAPSAQKLLELVGLPDKAALLAKELPFAELQRLEVARALATDPKVLLLDEMAAGLGPREVKQAARLIRSLKERGLTLVINDHLLTLTAQVSDRLAALDQGELLAVGPPEEVLHHPAVRAAYLGERRPEERGNGPAPA